MTLTPQQFNQLATKDDLVRQKEEIISEVGKKMDTIIITKGTYIAIIGKNCTLTKKL